MHVNSNLMQSAAIVLVAVFFGVVGRRWKRDDVVFHIVILLLLLLPSIWVPQLVRDIVLSLIVGAIMSFAGDSGLGKLAWAAASGGILFGLSRVVPGGATVLLAGLTLVLLGFFGHETWVHWKRISAADALTPNDKTKREVEIGGIARRLARVDLPDGYDEPKAAAWRAFDDDSRHGPALLSLETPAGAVMIEMGAIAIQDASYAHPTDVDQTDNADKADAADAAGNADEVGKADDPDKPDNAGAADVGPGAGDAEADADQADTGSESRDAESVGDADAGDTDEAADKKGADSDKADEGGSEDPVLDADTSKMLIVVEEGKDVYVIGTPTWTRAPEGMSGYRDAPVVPVFGEGSTLYLVSETEMGARTKWHLALAFGFLAACIIVATAQVLERFL